MELSSLAILFVFVGNAAGIIMLVFMLFRLQNQSEATHEMLSRGNRDMTDSGKRLRDVAQQMAKLAEQIAALNGQAAEQRAQDQERLGVQHGRMTEQLDRLAEQVARTQRLALESQRQAPERAAPGAASAPAMDDLLSQEVARLNTELERLRQQSGDEATRAAQQVQAITRQRDEFGRQLAQARDVIKRTQVEKDFIEDRLLALDHALTIASGGAAAATTAALPPVVTGGTALPPHPPQAAATAPTS